MAKFNEVSERFSILYDDLVYRLGHEWEKVETYCVVCLNCRETTFIRLSHNVLIRSIRSCGRIDIEVEKLNGQVVGLYIGKGNE